MLVNFGPRFREQNKFNSGYLAHFLWERDEIWQPIDTYIRIW